VQGLLYGQEVEWWAFGVGICTMLMGRPPFYDTDECRLADKIRTNEVKYPKPILRVAALIVSKVGVINIKTEALKMPYSRATICPILPGCVLL
jgi:serine/threonine protein kinase